MRGKLTGLRRIGMSALATALLMWILLYAPTPYVIYEPGLAVPVGPMIAFETGKREELPADAGQLLLTAVKLSESNFWGVMRASFNADRDVFKKRDIFKGSSRDQYAYRLNVIMQGSQHDAIEAAYRQTGTKYEIKPQSLIVMDALTIAGQKAGPLRSGDRLIGLEGGEPIHGIEDAVKAVVALGQPEKLSIEVERHNGERQSVQIQTGTGLSDPGLDAVRLAKLLGVTGFTELRSVVPDVQEHEIAIHAGEIGGPSAGLVFALQAVNMLTDGDLAGGLKIAATGTIKADGTVGAIGGIKQKVVSVYKEGAQLFLVPKANERDAAAKAKAMKIDMAVVGVSTLAEALEAIEAHRGAKSTS